MAPILTRSIANGDRAHKVQQKKTQEIFSHLRSLKENHLKELKEHTKNTAITGAITKSDF